MRKLLLALLLLLVSPATGQTIFYSGFEAGEGGPPVCPPLPDGWSLREKSWLKAFDYPNVNDPRPNPTYPNGVGNPVPVPGYENPGYFYQKGTIVAIPFIPLEDKTVDMTWDTAQAQSGYGTPRPADGMMVTITTCKWDAYPPLDVRCGMFAGGGSLFYTTRFPSLGACPVTAGVQYYINVVMANPYDGLDIGEHSCQDNAQNTITYNGCDVQMRHTGY